MKCPIDGESMEKGILSEDNHSWQSKSSWSGAFGSFGKVLNPGKPLWAYRCSKCGKVELTTE